MTLLSAGQNVPLNSSGPLRVLVTHQVGPVLDLTAFALGTDKRVRSDEDMVFYNQNKLTAEGVQWVASTTSGTTVTHTLIVDPTLWQARGIDSVRIALTADGTTFGEVRDLQAKVVDTQNVVLVEFDLSRRSNQNAFIIGEIYWRNGSLKARCESAGFVNGLAGLGRDVGVDIEEPSSTTTVPATFTGAPPAPPTSVNLVKQLAESTPAANASAVDLRKHKLAVVLVKNQLDGKIFRVVLSIDASGSMDGLYSRGVVQRSFERMVPIADLLDDNHEMEVWYFGSRPSTSDSVTIDTMDGYIARTNEQKKKAGRSNVEPLMMQEIIDWVDDNPCEYPTLILAWSDGGVGSEKQIIKKLVDSSGKPIFWMWLGLGRSNYGVLTRLQTIRGCTVQNAGFIQIDNIEQMLDEDLYSQIFAIVSRWYTAAKDKRVIAATH